MDKYTESLIAYETLLDVQRKECFTCEHNCNLDTFNGCHYKMNKEAERLVAIAETNKAAFRKLLLGQVD